MVLELWRAVCRQRGGIPAGDTQQAFDLCVFLIALFLLEPYVALLLTGAAIPSDIVITNYWQDRHLERTRKASNDGGFDAKTQNE